MTRNSGFLFFSADHEKVSEENEVCSDSQEYSDSDANFDNRETDDSLKIRSEQYPARTR